MTPNDEALRGPVLPSPDGHFASPIEHELGEVLVQLNLWWTREGLAKTALPHSEFPLLEEMPDAEREYLTQPPEKAERREELSALSFRAAVLFRARQRERSGGGDGHTVPAPHPVPDLERPPPRLHEEIIELLRLDPTAVVYGSPSTEARKLVDRVLEIQSGVDQDACPVVDYEAIFAVVLTQLGEAPETARTRRIADTIIEYCDWFTAYSYFRAELTRVDRSGRPTTDPTAN